LKNKKFVTGKMSHNQSLKSSNLVRVDAGKSYNLFGARQNQGESLMCPAGAQYIQHDIYGRPAGQNTLPVNLDSSCAMGSQYPLGRYLQVENNARPILPICTAGLRGAGDLMGVGRDLIPQNLYQEGARGNMVRQYNTLNNATPEWEPNNAETPYYDRYHQPYTFSHDSTKSAYYT